MINFPGPPLTDGQQFAAGNGVTYQWLAAPSVWSSLFTPMSTVAPVIVVSGTTTSVVSSNDEIIIRKTPGSPHTVTLEATPLLGIKHRITDGKGDAGTNNITVKNNGGTTIYVIAANYETATFRWDGSAWGWLP